MSSFYDTPDSRRDFFYPEIRPDPADRGRLLPAAAWRGRRAALLAGTVAAVAALMLAGRAPEPAPTVTVAAAPRPVAADAPAPVGQRVAAAPKTDPPVRLVRVAPPAHRPAQPVVTVSTRNAPTLSTRDIGGAATVSPPLPRPADLLATARVATPALDADRPMRRPASGDAVRAAVKATARAADGRPWPRPGGAPAPVAVASLSPTPTEMALAAQIAAPRARPEPPAAKRAAAPSTGAPAPRVAAPTKPAAPATAPAPAAQVVRGTPPAARVAAPAPAAPVKAARVAAQVPVRVVPVVAPATRVVRTAPAPARVAMLAPQAARTAAPAAPRPQATARKAAPAAVPQRTATRKPAPTTEREGLSRGNVSLIGVFSGENGRHALLLLPDGSIERVRPGDRVRGIQVAAIDAESVRLRGGGRDTLLRLPD